jgi:hypothetical protein
MSLVDFVQDSIDKASMGISHASSKALSLNGMSSEKVRHLLNNVCSGENTRYLEIGVWKGSTFYSALCGNKPEVALAIDNFSQFAGSEQEFLSTIDRLKTSKVHFLNANCWKLTTEQLMEHAPFNVYFYDGGHTAWEQQQALTYFLPALADEFIYICDDWNFPDVPKGTEAGLLESKLTVVKSWVLPAKFNGDTENWWNGLYVAILRKNAGLV